MFLLAHNDPNWIILGMVVGVTIGLGAVCAFLLRNNRNRD